MALKTKFYTLLYFRGILDYVIERTMYGVKKTSENQYSDLICKVEISVGIFILTLKCIN